MLPTREVAATPFPWQSSWRAAAAIFSPEDLVIDFAHTCTPFLYQPGWQPVPEAARRCCVHRDLQMFASGTSPASSPRRRVQRSDGEVIMAIQSRFI
jgi:hypothetical protein